MYDEFKSADLELTLIAQNARKFGIEALQNAEVLKLLFATPAPNLGETTLEAIKSVFSALEEVKRNSQMSG